jgi:hemolysin III
LESQPVAPHEQSLLQSELPLPWVALRSSGKPLLRGWIHAAAAVATATFTLIVFSRDNGITEQRLPLLIFFASMCELYTVSAVFHLGAWRKRIYGILRTLDHSSIYVAIASTYMPLCMAALAGWGRALLLGSAWLLALAGIVLTISAPRLPRAFRTGLYATMGWMAAPALPAMWHALPPPATILVLVGALIYSAGAVVYVRRLPDPFPRILGYHEIFHLCVVAGSAACGVAICLWVAPLL